VGRWILVLLVLAGLISPSRVAAVDLSQTCVNPDLPFAVRFPAGWWVYPEDPERDISPCERFGPAPFALTEDEDGALIGGTVTLYVADACVGHYLDVVTRQETTIAGRPVTRIELAASEGDPRPGPATALVYWIHLRGQECESPDSRYLVASTASSDPDAYAQNAAVLDAMMESFVLGTIPDGAMSAKAAIRPIQWLGVVLLAAALWLGLWPTMRRRWRARQGPSRRSSR
jgi:hypothetical protein